MVEFFNLNTKRQIHHLSERTIWYIKHKESTKKENTQAWTLNVVKFFRLWNEWHCSTKFQTDLQLGIKGKEKNKKEDEFQQVMSIYLKWECKWPKRKGKYSFLCLKNIHMVSYFTISAYLTFRIKYLYFFYKTEH